MRRQGGTSEGHGDGRRRVGEFGFVGVVLNLTWSGPVCPVLGTGERKSSAGLLSSPVRAPSAAAPLARGKSDPPRCVCRRLPARC